MEGIGVTPPGIVGITGDTPITIPITAHGIMEAGEAIMVMEATGIITVHQDIMPIELIMEKGGVPAPMSSGIQTMPAEVRPMLHRRLSLERMPIHRLLQMMAKTTGGRILFQEYSREVM